jgi:hypothetical protein
MRYRCSCGYETDERPSTPGREIVSVYHIHRRSDIRDLADAVCMEPVRTPAPGLPSDLEVAAVAG